MSKKQSQAGLPQLTTMATHHSKLPGERGRETEKDRESNSAKLMTLPLLDLTSDKDRKDSGLQMQATLVKAQHHKGIFRLKSADDRPYFPSMWKARHC